MMAHPEVYREYTDLQHRVSQPLALVLDPSARRAALAQKQQDVRDLDI